jgi:signal transduction histidine kinase
MSIRAKLSLMIGGLLVLLAGTIAGGLYVAEGNALRYRLEATRISTLHQFSQTCRDAFLVHDELAAVGSVQALSRSPGVVQAFFVNGKGQVLAHSDAQKMGSRYALPKPVAPLKSKRKTPRWTESREGDRVILSEPVPLGKGPPGTAVLVFSQRFLEDFVRTSLHGFGRRVLEVTGLALLLGLLGAWALARNLIRPIESLARATRRLAAGDLDHRIQVKRGDELGRLGEDFNGMAERLGELDRMKEDFVSNVTHELRSPLSAIESYANVISDEWRADRKENIPDYLTILRNNATRLGRFINDILDTAKIEARAVEVRKQQLDPVLVLNDVASLFLPKAREKNIQLVVTPVSAGLSLFADPDKLHQILTNLTANALKFTPVGGAVTLQADSVSPSMDPCAKEPPSVRLSVRDTGPGICPEDQTRIFNRFEQVRDIRNRVRGAKGTGLGLAIARGLAEAHGGELTLNSTVGQGSVFSVILPGER